MYLLDFSIDVQTDFLRWVKAGAIDLVAIDDDDLERTIELVEKYRDLPADFADASLVAQAERLRIDEIASIDRDFAIYRLKGRKTFRNIFLH